MKGKESDEQLKVLCLDKANPDPDANCDKLKKSLWMVIKLHLQALLDGFISIIICRGLLCDIVGCCI